MIAFRFSQLLHLTLALAAGSLAHAATPDQILGTWSPDNGRDSRIEISQCGRVYCGAIVWMRIPHADDNNVDPSQRKRPLVAARILNNFKYESGSTWAGGKIYNPQHGKSFEGRIVMLNKNELEVYEGESKKPIIWKRVTQ